MTSAVSKKYSKALFMVTKAKENTRQVTAELEVFYNAIHKDDGLKHFFDDPLAETSTKLLSLKVVLDKNQIAQETKEFLTILVKNKRFSALGDILAEVKNLVDLDAGIQRGTITAAQAIDPQTIQSIEKEFEKILKNKIQLEYKNDPELVGGLVAEVAGFTFDDSLENHLKKLSENLMRY